MALAVMLWWLHRRAAITAPQVIVSVAVCVYGAGVVANTLLRIYIDATDYRQPWTDFLNLVPLVDTDPADMLQNVVVFLPLGVLLPIVAHVDSARRVRRPHRRPQRPAGQHSRRAPRVRRLPGRAARGARGPAGRRHDLAGADRGRPEVVIP
jgi:hypothetical protein